MSNVTPLGAARYPPPATEIAVVVCARRDGPRIAATLAALAEAFPGARAIVADDASDDETPAVARAAGAELVRPPRPAGRGAVATLAAERFRGGAAPTVVLCRGGLGDAARELPRLVEALDAGGVDVVLGAPAAGGAPAGGRAERAARRLIATCAPALAGLRAPAARERVLRPEALAATLPFAGGEALEAAITLDAHLAGFRVAELELAVPAPPRPGLLADRRAARALAALAR